MKPFIVIATTLVVLLSGCATGPSHEEISRNEEISRRAEELRVQRAQAEKAEAERAEAAKEAEKAKAVKNGDMCTLVVSLEAHAATIAMALQQHWEAMDVSDAEFLTSGLLPLYGFVPGSGSGNVLIPSLCLSAEKKFLSFDSALVGSRRFFREACYYDGKWYVRK